MERVLSERHKRAEGARAEAEAGRVVTQEKRRLYNETLKRARGEVFSEQEIQRRRTLEDRQATINAARASAQTVLQEAKIAIASDVVAARAELESSKDTLANEIAEAILAGRPSGPGSSQAKGAR